MICRRCKKRRRPIHPTHVSRPAALTPALSQREREHEEGLFARGTRAGACGATMKDSDAADVVELVDTLP